MVGRVCATAALAIMLSSCAGVGRMMSYGSDWADAKVDVGVGLSPLGGIILHRNLRVMEHISS